MCRASPLLKFRREHITAFLSLRLRDPGGPPWSPWQMPLHLLNYFCSTAPTHCQQEIRPGCWLYQQPFLSL